MTVNVLLAVGSGKLINSAWQKNTILLIGGVESARKSVFEQAIF